MIIWSILSFIAILGLLVLVHELGHFLVARLFHVAVEEFGFGFPPRLFGKKFGKTLYTINAIPLGGFVKIQGFIENPDVDQSIRAPEDFMTKSLWQRFAILMAGIVMNYLLTIVLFAAIFTIGSPSYLDQIPAGATVTDQAIIVADIAAEIPAAQAGLTAGDHIVAISDEPVLSVSSLRTALATYQPNDTITIVVERADQTLELVTTTTALPDGGVGIGASLLDTGIVKLPVHLATWQAVKQTGVLTVSMTQAVGGLISRIFQGDSVSGDVSGPVGIAQLTHQATQLGFVYVLQLAALLSINLAFFNLFPFPPLDGGKLIFVVFEAITRKPVSARWQIIIHNIGFVLFLIFIMAVTVKDVIGIGSSF